MIFLDNDNISWLTNIFKKMGQKYIEPVWKDGGIPVQESLEINIENEKGAIQTYEKIVTMTEDIDPVTNSKAKEIIADEMEHLQELKDFLNDIK